jgi:hypothetical protein
VNDFEEDNFYWCKIRYDLGSEPLIRWEVLHYEEGCWWARAHGQPFPDSNILEVRCKLERPDD